MRSSIPFFLLITLFLCVSVFAGVEYKEVESTGYGVNESDAIKDALIQALSQIKGTYIKSERISAVQRSINQNKESIHKDSKSKISSYTMGLISSYEVLSSGKDPDRLYEVRIRATIPKYEAGPQTKRLRMAILPFESIPDLQNADSAKFLAAWARELEEGLVQTRKFAILDRTFQKSTNSELESYLNGHKAEEISKLGQKLGTDYILIGTLINYKPKNIDSNKLEIGNSRISLRIIDVATGQIKYARKVSSAKLSVSQILDAIYPIPIVSVKPREIIFGVGGDNLKVGDNFEIFSLGKELYDPYTKESLGFDEISLGFARVTRVNPKTAVAEIDEKLDLRKLFSSGKLIARSSVSEIKHSNSSFSPSDNEDW